MIVSKYFIIFLFALKISFIVTKSETWLSGLINYLQGQTHQALLLFERKKDHEVANIIKQISNNVPTFKITFEEATDEKAKDLSLLPAFNDPRSTTLTIIIKPPKDNKFEDLINFLAKVSETRSRPKCLIICAEPDKNMRYVKLLHRMWLKKFLDVSILEISKKSNEALKGKLFLDSRWEIVGIHTFNPFTGILKRENYTSRGGLLFPEKIQNLHGYEMKVGVFHYPPAINFIRNKTGHVTNMIGPDIMTTKTFSTTMNFKIQWISRQLDAMRIRSCVKEDTSGFIHDLSYNEIQFVVGQTGVSKICDFFEYTTVTKSIRICIVVPNFPDDSVELSSEWKLLSCLLLVSFLSFNWIITRFLRFDSRNWQLEYFLQLYFGIVVPREPRKLTERIFFGSILTSCLLHSTFIFSVFTNVSLQRKHHLELNSIQDVVSSKLEVITTQVAFEYFYKITDGSSRILLDKATLLNISYIDCLKRLIETKTIACIVRDDVAQWMIDTERNSCGESPLKIVPEYLSFAFAGILVERASPFVSQFNKIILKLRNNGLIEKWLQEKPVRTYKTDLKSKDVCYLQSSEFALIRNQLFFFLAFGYSCAIFAFLCELLTDYVKIKARRPHHMY